MRQDEAYQGRDLFAACVDGAAACAVDGWRGDDGCSYGPGIQLIGGQDNLVDVAVVGLVREGDETGDVGDVIVGFGGKGWEAVAAVGLVVLLERKGLGLEGLVGGGRVDLICLPTGGFQCR